MRTAAAAVLAYMVNRLVAAQSRARIVKANVAHVTSKQQRISIEGINGGCRKIISIFFVDVRGSALMSQLLSALKKRS